MAKVRKPKVPAAPPPASYIDAELVRIEAWARTGLEMAGLDPGRFAPISREAERHAAGSAQLDKLGEVRERSREP